MPGYKPADILDKMLPEIALLISGSDILENIS